MLAHQLLLDGHAVHIFDRDDAMGSLSCGWAGAGMLAPYSELESADEPIYSLGRESLALWPELIKNLVKPVFFQHAGTLVVAHAQDRAELSRFRANMERKLDSIAASGLSQASFNHGHAWRAATMGGQDARAPSEEPLREILQNIDGAAITELEPELSGRFQSAIYLPDEGQVDNRQLFEALTHTLKANGAQWTCGVPVDRVEPYLINGIESTQFDLVIDTRGLGAKKDLPELRGVRGEIIRLLATEVNLSRPIRLMHPRYPIYIVPRPDHHFLIGATAIESEDEGPVSVQSALELLSAAFSLHSGFAEASILEMTARCRPAMIDNCPKIYLEPGLLRVNGLYRHGFLISPKLVELITALIKNDLKVDSQLEIEPTYLSTIIENRKAATQPLPHSSQVAKLTNIVN